MNRVHFGVAADPEGFEPSTNSFLQTLFGSNLLGTLATKGFLGGCRPIQTRPRVHKSSSCGLKSLFLQGLEQTGPKRLLECLINIHALYRLKPLFSMEMAITPGKILVFDDKKKVAEEQFSPESLNETLSKISGNYNSPTLKSYKLNFLCSETGSSEKDYLEKLVGFSFELTASRIKDAVKRDELIVQAVNSIEDLNREINFLTTRLREWYGTSDPESAKIIDDHEKLVDKVIEKVDVSNFGLKLEDKDAEMIQYFAKFINENYRLREKLEKYVDSIMEELAPNVRALVGPILGAKLMARAGGLYKLAIMPGSTIQVIGAEKALFRHLIKKTPSPKHGLIFQHPLISNKPRALRGRIARSLAAKISIAARLDYYGKGLDPSLIKSFEKRMKELEK